MNIFHSFWSRRVRFLIHENVKQLRSNARSQPRCDLDRRQGVAVHRAVAWLVMLLLSFPICSQIEYDTGFMYDVSLQIESEFNGETKSIVPAEHKKHRHKWVLHFVHARDAFANKIDTLPRSISDCFMTRRFRSRHQHHDHERCKERKKRKRRKILVHNLDDKSLKVSFGISRPLPRLTQNVFYYSFESRQGNRSWWASRACKVHHNRHCMSSPHNVFAARRNNTKNGSTYRWHGWVSAFSLYVTAILNAFTIHTLSDPHHNDSFNAEKEAKL